MRSALCCPEGAFFLSRGTAPLRGGGGPVSLPCWDSRFRGRRGKHGERQGFSRSSQPAEGSGGGLRRANEEFPKAPGSSRFERCTCESALPQIPTVGEVPFWENPVSGVSCACLDDCKRGPLCCQPVGGISLPSNAAQTHNPHHRRYSLLLKDTGKS